MKTAIVTPTLSHFEVPLFRVAANLRGLDVCVFHLDQRGDDRIDPDYGTTINWGDRLRDGYENRSFDSIEALHAGLLDWRPGVALQYGYAWPGALKTLRTFRRRSIPVIQRGTLSPLADPRSNPIKNVVRRAVRPAVLGLFSAHHYGGTFSQKVLRDAGIPDDRMYFVPYSIDTSYFANQADSAETAIESAALRGRLGWDCNNPVLLMLGQQAWVKGPDLVMQIAKAAQIEFPTLKLLVVGDGPTLDESRRTAEATLTPGSYHFSGFVPSKQTAAYYALASMMLVPSRYETWARAVNEAMLFRVPCIVSKYVAASGGLVEHGVTGYVIDNLNTKPFVDCIRDHLNSPPGGRARMVEAARERALYFSYEAHSDELRRSFVETAEAATIQTV